MGRGCLKQFLVGCGTVAVGFDKDRFNALWVVDFVRFDFCLSYLSRPGSHCVITNRDSSFDAQIRPFSSATISNIRIIAEKLDFDFASYLIRNNYSFKMF